MVKKATGGDEQPTNEVIATPTLNPNCPDDSKNELCLDDCDGGDISPAIVRIFNPCDPNDCPIIIDCSKQYEGVTLSINRQNIERRDQCQAGVAEYIKGGFNVSASISLAEGSMDCRLAELVYEGKWELDDNGLGVMRVADNTGECPKYRRIEIIPLGGKYTFVIPWGSIYTETQEVQFTVDTQRQTRLGFYAKQSPFPKDKGAKYIIIDNSGTCVENAIAFEPFDKDGVPISSAAY